MKKIILTVVISVGLLGCTQAVKVPLAVNPEKLKGSNVSDGYAHVYIGQDHIKYPPVTIMIDSHTITQIGYETYAYFKLQPGKHWLNFNIDFGVERQSRTKCLNLEKNSSQVFGWFDVQDINNLYEDKGLKSLTDRKQTFQNYENLLPSEPTFSASSIMIEVDNGIAGIKKVLSSNLAQNGFKKGSDLTIKVSSLSKTEGNQLARWFWGSSKEDKAVIATKAEFFVNGKKIDEFKSVKELTGGFFGGNVDSLYSEIADDLSSYVSCKFK